MPKICDHTSVGMLVEEGDALLLIERKKPPFGFAPPAGHVDSDTSFEEAARRELEEEVGLNATKLELLTEGRKENSCRREGGTCHYWRIYRVETEGMLKRSEDETKQARFVDKDELAVLAMKTEKYLTGGVSQAEWEKSPGLEPVWYEWFHELHIL